MRINGQRQSAYRSWLHQRWQIQNLKWETTITRDIGTDLLYLRIGLSRTVDVYKNTTKDLLMLDQYSRHHGFYCNLCQYRAKQVTKELELSLSEQILETRDWHISAGGNINFNQEQRG